MCFASVQASTSVAKLVPPARGRDAEGMEVFLAFSKYL